MTSCAHPGPYEIPDTPLLSYFRSEVFSTPRGKAWAKTRLDEAKKFRNNPGVLAEWFAASVATVECCYRNYQPFYPSAHEFSETHGQSLTATVDVARRLAARAVCDVPNDPRLNFRYLDREIEIARSRPTAKKPPQGTLIVDLFLANASDRTPILSELKIAGDQCSYYAFIQLLTQAAYAATPSQRERLVLFGSQPDFVLREAVPGQPGRIDLYILLVDPKPGSSYDDIRAEVVPLSKKLLADSRVNSKIRRIAWLKGSDDGAGGLTLAAIS